MLVHLTDARSALRMAIRTILAGLGNRPKLGVARCLDIGKMKEVFRKELELRRVKESVGFSDFRGGAVSLYGTVGAVNICQVLGFDHGSWDDRQKRAERILSFQDDDFSFPPPDSKAHALCMVLQALNILGANIPEEVQPLAPLDVQGLREVLRDHDWASTHKELWGMTAPLLATGTPDKEWRDSLLDVLGQRLTLLASPVTWSGADMAPARLISCMYHIFQIYDAGRVPLPKADLILKRLLGLDWPLVRQREGRTYCTDADWAWMLSEVVKQSPRMYPLVSSSILKVSRQRVLEWNLGRVELAQMSTHHLYCYLWSTALFQDLDRAGFVGSYIMDTLNQPAFFRLGRSPM